MTALTGWVRHFLTLVAVGAGIFGFGLIYQGLAHGRPSSLTTGIPVLLIGLWWAGKELGRSNMAAKRRRVLRDRGG